MTEVHSIHFSGICGTAMASTAAAAKEKGFHVSGSDQNVYPPMSTFLQGKGIEITSPFAENNLRHTPDLVVIGNVLSRGNPEVEAVLERKLPYCSLPELLKLLFLRGKRSVVVTGTHGKTTSTALLAWVFECNGLNPSFFIGGVTNNFGQGARFTRSEWFVIEGDEYDTAFFDKRSKFVHYLPEVAIVNNLEFDHADIFPDLAAVQTTFQRFINLIPRNGLLLANGDDVNLAPLLQVKHCPITRFGLGEMNDIRAESLRFGPQGSRFEVGASQFRIPLVGEFNVRNALGVIACARHCGLSDRQIQSGFDTFTGIKRRLEVVGTAGGVTVVDDFAHHPTAIRETLRALRSMFPESRLWAIFEPRSNTTRRSVFQNEIRDALAAADLVVISEVARLELLPEKDRLDPTRLIQELNSAGKPAAYVWSVPDIVEHVARNAKDGDVVCVLSNGGFGGIHRLLMEKLSAWPIR